jgi:hypothetical protein
MQSILIGFGKNRNSCNAHAFTGSDYSDGDFATISYKNF